MNTLISTTSASLALIAALQPGALSAGLSPRPEPQAELRAQSQRLRRPDGDGRDRRGSGERSSPNRPADPPRRPSQGRSNERGGGPSSGRASGRSSGRGNDLVLRPPRGLGSGSQRPAGGWVDRNPGSGNFRSSRNNAVSLPARTGRSVATGSSRWRRPIYSRPVIAGNTVNVSRSTWVGPSWSSRRPWSHGWYGSGWSDSRPSWWWWNGSSVIWGISQVASAAIIANAVNNAVSTNSDSIPVSNSAYRLRFGSVQPIGSKGVEFLFDYDGRIFSATADCQRGELNGERPYTPAEAELLNAACAVAFASF
ncbi:hypothetical protein [Cyanobium sp. LEGE 06113]|uniref:hypothetical protein n=1 Tax=Cyanobium sp. LEGE 06113 TaxID=1297573 RepID=UPI00187F8D32|nr:hypothetical protein [Cyanobium sp. LEGE 06113]MBE9153591.1 hypothetical protein [Cyanobium sp. LEGE 06113]